jgi:hypothetical protein
VIRPSESPRRFEGGDRAILATGGVAVNNWYSKQFGDSDELALALSFGRDPHPSGDAVREATWGGVEIWVRGGDAELSSRQPVGRHS